MSIIAGGLTLPIPPLAPAFSIALLVISETTLLLPAHQHALLILTQIQSLIDVWLIVLLFTNISTTMAIGHASKHVQLVIMPILTFRPVCQSATPVQACSATQSQINA